MPEARDVCIVFADVAGSTALYERLGDAAALAAVERCLATLTEVVQLNRGRVIKTIGDEIMAAFDSAAQGMQAAMEMQQRIDALLPPTQGPKLAIRIGFQHGPALVENDDIFGDTVNIAARLVALAKPAQIITTAETVAALPEFLRQSVRVIDALSMKGKSATVRVCEAIWQQGAELTMMSASLTPASGAAPRLLLRRGAEELLLGPARPQASFGRDSTCDMALRHPRASRLHARIERRRDKYVLVDLSSNGTYVTFQGETEIVLRREEVPLRGSGRIVFGQAGGGADAETVGFALEE